MPSFTILSSTILNYTIIYYTILYCTLYNTLYNTAILLLCSIGLHQEHISWGTFQDAMCRRDLDEWHCNAHANNLVLLPEPSYPLTHTHSHTHTHTNPFQPSSQLDKLDTVESVTRSTSPMSKYVPMLGFLDLDMAYQQEMFVTATATKPVPFSASSNTTTTTTTTTTNPTAYCLIRLAVIVMGRYVA